MTSSPSSSSSLRVPDISMSIAGKIRRSASWRLSTSSWLPVPLNSSKMTWSMREPVSTSVVPRMVSEPPSSHLRAEPKNFFGISSTLAPTPPDIVAPPRPPIAEL